MISLWLENLARRWRVAWRFQIFLMATDLFLFTQMLFMLTLGSTKKSCIAQKTVVSTKKNIFRIEINVAQQNCEPQKNMLWQQKILCDTQKKTHVD